VNRGQELGRDADRPADSLPDGAVGALTEDAGCLLSPSDPALPPPRGDLRPRLASIKTPPTLLYPVDASLVGPDKLARILRLLRD